MITLTAYCLIPAVKYVPKFTYKVQNGDLFLISGNDNLKLNSGNPPYFLKT